MEYSHRYRAYPTQSVAERLENHIDIHRQAYNYARYEYYNLRNVTNHPRTAYEHHERLPKWKEEFPMFSEVHSKALQRTVTRFYHNLSNLTTSKRKGQKVGILKWKSPNAYQSITYSQSGFELKNTSGRIAILRLTKIGDIRIRYHRELPNDATIKEVTVKKESTGEWFVSFALSANGETPKKPELDNLDINNCVGIDLGIINYIYTSDGLAVDRLDLEAEYESLSRQHHKLSRKQVGSQNYEKQRIKVAKVNRRIQCKVLDFQHKLTKWLVESYDAVFVEDLNVRGMLEQQRNSRNLQDAAWRQFITLLEYKGDRYGTHVIQVDARGTTLSCASCGSETPKPVDIRVHVCPSCGFESHRDANAAMNILQKGLRAIGLGWPESTPVETALPTETLSVPAKRVVETGSPTFNSTSIAAESR